MRITFVSFFLFAFGLATSAATRDGIFSRLATPIWSIARQPKGLASPDGLGIIHAVEVESSADDSWPFKTWVTRSGRNYRLPFGGFVSAEVAWSPDSSSFFVTYSDGGAVGLYHVLVYSIDKAGLHSAEPIRNGSRLLRTTCFTPEDPNLGAIRWGTDSKSLLIAAEVPPHSNCALMGTFRAVEIAVPGGKVLKAYNQLEAKRVFGEILGIELRNADDDCVKKPRSCVPPGLRLPISHRGEQGVP
jgi:hypothetical protein